MRPSDLVPVLVGALLVAGAAAAAYFLFFAKKKKKQAASTSAPTADSSSTKISLVDLEEFRGMPEDWKALYRQLVARGTAAKAWAVASAAWSKLPAADRAALLAAARAKAAQVAAALDKQLTAAKAGTLGKTAVSLAKAAMK